MNNKAATWPNVILESQMSLIGDDDGHGDMSNIGDLGTIDYSTRISSLANFTCASMLGFNSSTVSYISLESGFEAMIGEVG